MRADAQRNYDRLLRAADAQFTERGADASLEEIAKRAAVGIGTLYRHFPTRGSNRPGEFNLSALAPALLIPAREKVGR